MDSDFSLDFLKVVEQAAIACAHTMGQDDAHKADQAAVEAMRKSMDALPIDGRIVIGEGERDEAPMLYIGEKVGESGRRPDDQLPAVDIAVDPLEGTNLCAQGVNGAIAVLAAAERGGLLHAPDCYMEKLVVGPRAKHAVFLDAPVAHNLQGIAKALDRHVEDLVVVVLDRPQTSATRSPTFARPGRASGSFVTAICPGGLPRRSRAPASTPSWASAERRRACSRLQPCAASTARSSVASW